MKKLLILTIVLLAFERTNAQISFSHAVGVKYYTITGEDAEYSSVGILYSPRLNVAEVGDNSTVSIGTHIGLAFEANSRSTGESSSSFVYDIPLVAEFNFGNASSRDNDSGFGFYAGGGYGMHNSSVFDKAMTGPVVNGGLRFLIANKPLDLNVSYLKGTGNFKDFGLIGVGIQYTLGM